MNMSKYDHQQKEQIMTGVGFESNQNMTRYKIFNSQGEFPVEDTPKSASDTVQVENSFAVDSLNKK